MERLPNELFLHIASFLDPLEVIDFSLVSKRFLLLLRDNSSWRLRCYEGSRAAARHRRQAYSVQQSSNFEVLAQRAESGLLDALLASSTASNAPNGAPSKRSETQARSLANWDPSYSSEKVDFYQEYVHRHAPITLNWFERMGGDVRGEAPAQEATGAGMLYDERGRASRLYALLDNGRVGVWSASPTEESSRSNPQRALAGRFLSASKEAIPSLQGHRQPTSQDTGVVECMSIDSKHKRGYLAVANTLFQVDLNTLQPISNHAYSWAISALSESLPGIPLTVGTTCELHLYDPRSPLKSAPEPPNGVESTFGALKAHSVSQLINSPAPKSALLSQPLPLSILNLPSDHAWGGNGDIWVAGRFTHLLNYDRRFFPRLRGTVHSGAHISSITALPYPYIPRQGIMGSDPLSLAQLYEAKQRQGTTLIAAGHYKGKGSLELYGLSSDQQYTTNSSNAMGSGRGSFTMTGNGHRGHCAQNRQTASSSKLLAVANHGLKLAYSDGDAKVKWVERDGFTPVRQFSIDPGSSLREGDRTNMPVQSGLFSDVASGDIVQKLIPTLHHSTLASSKYTPPLHEDNLVIWTGDGRLGMLGFHRHAAWDEALWEERAEMAKEELARFRLEQEHGSRMREALQWQANEVRFMNGWGMPFAPGL